MPRYFFHAYDDVLAVDDTGTILPDLQHAKAHAARAAVSVFKERMAHGEWEDWLMEIADEHGRVLLRFIRGGSDVPSEKRLTVLPGEGLAN